MLWLNDPDALVAEVSSRRQDKVLEAEMEQIISLLKETERGRTNIQRALAAGLVDLDESTSRMLRDLKNRKNQLEKRKREIEAALRENKAFVAQAKSLKHQAKKYLNSLDSMTFEQKRALVRLLVRRVSVQMRDGQTVITVYAAFAPAAIAVATDNNT